MVAEFGQSIAGRRKLYLDARYWVFLREAVLGRAKRVEHDEILHLLRRLVSAGAALCPISDAAFMELMKQTDDVTRVATAKLMDELSLGVALHSERDRVRAELEHFLEYPEAGSDPEPLKNIVWVKPCYVLGVSVPVSAELSPSINRIVQKATIDMFWQMTLQQFVENAASVVLTPDNFEKAAAQINIDMPKHAHQVRSIEQAFVAEIAGVLSIFKTDISRIIVRLHEKRMGNSVSATDQEFFEFEKAMLNALVNCFRYARGKMAQHIPTLYVHAMCHAAIRMDRTRKFNGHDLLDLHHASAGVAYHDAMFTENPLRVLLTAGNVALDKKFGCQIISAEHDVIDYLKTLQ